MASQSFVLILRKSRMVTPRVCEFSFICEDESILDFIPGQFITLWLNYEGKTILRSYSLNTTENGIQFAATKINGGRATDILFNMKSGERVNAKGPYGRLILRNESPARYILVATGTGVTPYREMLPHLKNSRVDLLLGVRSPEELLYGDEFKTFAQNHPNFRFIPCYSRYQERQYVQDILYNISPNPENDIVYLCGNPEMIDSATAYLKDIGFQIKNIRREKYLFGRTLD